MNKKPRSRKLTIYLAKKDVSEDQLFHKRKILSQFPVLIEQRQLGTLYIEPSHSKQPRWFEFLAESVDIEDIALFNASSGAVLTIPVNSRIFAITFGTGFHYLDHAWIEPNFGLRTTLNSVSPDRIRSVDRKKLHAVSHDTREQASREVNITEFGLDIEQDLLRGVTAPPEDPRLGVRLSGTTSLSAQAKITLDDLRDLLALYLRIPVKLSTDSA